MKAIILSFLILITASVCAQKTKPAVKKNKEIYPWLHTTPKTEKKIKVVYETTTDTNFTVWYETFKNEKFLEKMAKVVNSVFKLEKQLTFSVRSCGEVNAYYSSTKQELILCYELLDDLYKIYADSLSELNPDSLGAKIGNTLTFVYFHEMGHALIDLLDIPITSQEEDAADYFSFYFLASNEVPEGVTATMEGANYFMQSYQKMIKDTAYQRYVAENKEAPLPFWDEHSLDAQRFYNLASLIYGSNPEKYHYFIEAGYLGGRRPGIAIKEFKKIKKGWDRLLKPYIKFK